MSEQVPEPDDLSCRQVVGLITDYLDDALSPADREQLEEHLAECDGCATVLEQFRVTVELTGHLEPDDVDQLGEPTRADLLGVFRRWAADRPVA